MNKNDWRQKILTARRSLPVPLLRSLNTAIYHHVRRILAVRRFQRIGLYYPIQGEVDTLDLIAQLWCWHRQCYLPILPPPRGRNRLRLQYALFTTDSIMQNDRFGIPEPTVLPRHRLRARDLDCVLVPLVAIDSRGVRLGMGGGYYDHSFAFRHQPSHGSKPQLIGLAYGFQCLAQLPCDPWDITLDAVVTEQGLQQARPTPTTTINYPADS